MAVVNLADNSVSLFLASKHGGLVSGPVLKVGKHPYAVAVGDLNGDGKADIATADHDDNSVTVLLSK